MSSQEQSGQAPHVPGRTLVLTFAVACGLIVANIYYAQPLIALIAPELGLHTGLAGVIVALTQLGFGAGLLLVVPLGDRFENRGLVLLTLSALLVALIGVALSDSMLTFLVASFAVGVSAVATQILIPFVSQLVPAASRGSVIGVVVGGLVAGIMLARPFASYIAALFGWRTVFALAACFILILIVTLRLALPQRWPAQHLGYPAILRSLPGLVANTPPLRRRAFYQGMLFAAFNMFWTASPLLLAQQFDLGHKGIALFTLAAAAGALSAPLAGRLADRGLTRPATGYAIGAVVLALLLSLLAAQLHSIAVLVIAALVLDAAIQVNQVLSLRCIYMLAPELRGRLTGLYMAFVFACGAVGSSAAAALYVFGSWTALAIAGAAFAAAALLFYVTEFRAPRAVSSPT
ncbi:MFS transporter [Povalibacter sp.]|uniref:MFS transporter n=1 Tax=Povalibacter sp. TaxID=1962978 RepID=UPI002F4093AB